MEKKQEQQHPHLQSYSDLFCPILSTDTWMEDPVITYPGYTYERSGIELWFQKNSREPMSNVDNYHKKLIPNVALKNLMDEFSHADPYARCCEKAIHRIEEAKKSTETFQPSKNPKEHFIWPLGLICPLTLKVFQDPVITHEGITYERTAIVDWLKINSKDPLTQNPLSIHELIPNRALKNSINLFLKARKQADQKLSASVKKNHEEIFSNLKQVCLKQLEQHKKLTRSQFERKQKKRRLLFAQTTGILTTLGLIGYYVYSNCHHVLASSSNGGLTDQNEWTGLSTTLMCTALWETTKNLKPFMLFHGSKHAWKTLDDYQETADPSEQINFLLEWGENNCPKTSPEEKKDLPKTTLSTLSLCKDDMYFMRLFWKLSKNSENNSHLTEGEKFIFSLIKTENLEIIKNYLNRLFLEAPDSKFLLNSLDFFIKTLNHLLKKELNETIEILNFLKKQTPHGLNIQDHNGNTLLHILATILPDHVMKSSHHTALFDWLAKQIDINVLDNKKLSAMDYALKKTNTMAVKVLLANGAYADFKNILNLYLNSKDLELIRLFINGIIIQGNILRMQSYIIESLELTLNMEKMDLPVLKLLVGELLEQGSIKNHLLQKLPTAFWETYPEIAKCFKDFSRHAKPDIPCAYKKRETSAFWSRKSHPALTQTRSQENIKTESDFRTKPLA